MAQTQNNRGVCLLAELSRENMDQTARTLDLFQPWYKVSLTLLSCRVKICESVPIDADF